MPSDAQRGGRTPAGRGQVPAPGQLGIVQEFVNTRYGQGARAHEELGDPAATMVWIGEHVPNGGFLGRGKGQVTAGDVRRLHSAREAIRVLLRAHSPALQPALDPMDHQYDAPDRAETTGPADGTGVADASGYLSAIAHDCPLIVQVRADGAATLVPDLTGIDGVLGHILGAVVLAMQQGTWRRLKVCRNGRCERAFYDTSKNGSGVWCSTKTCGNRMNARASRLRRRARQDNRSGPIT